jgi:hypothetical protein
MWPDFRGLQHKENINQATTTHNNKLKKKMARKVFHTTCFDKETAVCIRGWKRDRPFLHKLK